MLRPCSSSLLFPKKTVVLSYTSSLAGRQRRTDPYFFKGREHALPLQSPYTAAKHGVEGFLESLRVELQHEGVSTGALPLHG